MSGGQIKNSISTQYTPRNQNEVTVCRNIILESYMEALDQEEPCERKEYLFLLGRVEVDLFEQQRPSSSERKTPSRSFEPLNIPELEHKFNCSSSNTEEVNSFNNRSTSENTPDRVSSSRLEKRQMDEEILGKRVVRQPDEMVEEFPEEAQKGEKFLSGNCGRDDDEFSFKDSSN